MGKMKEVCIQIIEANGGIPPGMTIEDVVRMQDWNVYQWQEYEREQKKARAKHFESENPREADKIEQSKKKFSKISGKAKETKRD